MGEFADDAIDRGITDMFRDLDDPEVGMEGMDENPSFAATDAFNDFSAMVGAPSRSCLELTAPDQTDYLISSLALQAALGHRLARRKFTR